MATVDRLVRLFVRDRDGNQGKYTLRLSSLDVMADTLDSVLSVLVPATHDIIDAVAVMASVIYHTSVDYTIPSSGSLVSYKCLVFWRNTDDDLASLVIPALKDTIDIGTDPIYGNVLDLTVFDELTDTLSDLGAIDVEGIPINGTVVAAALFV